MTFFALQQWELWAGIVISAALFAVLLIPFLFEEIERGKADPGPDLPIGAGDVHPGSVGNPVPDQTPVQPAMHEQDATLSLGSFHTFLIWASIVLASGTTVWAFFNHEVVFGLVAFGFAILLTAYGGYFAQKAQRDHLH